MSLDISPIARLAFIEPHVELSLRLWRELAGEDPFTMEDPRLLEFCWSMIRTVVTNTALHQEFGPFHHTLWARAVVADREVSYKLVTHPTPGNAKEPMMTILSSHEKTRPANEERRQK
jgi:hypothetical protein